VRVPLCLTIPGKVVELRGEFAIVDYGKQGVRENARTTMVPVKVGDYVLVQGGFVIRVLSSREATEAIRDWETVQHALEDSGGEML
jgi:hydrogenase assembly chaperone HypC/HupF